MYFTKKNLYLHVINSIIQLIGEFFAKNCLCRPKIDLFLLIDCAFTILVNVTMGTWCLLIMDYIYLTKNIQLSSDHNRKIFPTTAACHQSKTSTSRKAFKQQRAALERDSEATWLGAMHVIWWLPLGYTVSTHHNSQSYVSRSLCSLYLSITNVLYLKILITPFVTRATHLWDMAVRGRAHDALHDMRQRLRICAHLQTKGQI